MDQAHSNQEGKKFRNVFDVILKKDEVNGTGLTR